MNYELMTTDRERAIVLALLNAGEVNLFENKETNTVLREELNDDVLSHFERNEADLAFPADAVEPDYSALTSEKFDVILKKIIEETSNDTLLGIGDVYTIVREELNNKVLDVWAKEHLTSLFESKYIVVNDGGMVYGGDAAKINDDTVEVCFGLDTFVFNWDDLIDANQSGDSYFCDDESGEECQISFYKAKPVI
tara:strand:+ start:16559 stop:17143 length:585 start_codon:yes stop_codon:yes gene_type:complete